jgi:hypothetical protein
LLVPLIAVLFALLTAEAALRLATGRHQPRDVAKRYHPTLGWEKIPNSVRTEDTSEFSVRSLRNSRGLRGRSVPYEKPAGEFRVLMLGDSFLEGYTVGDEQLVSTQLGNLSGVTTINAGTGGYSTDQQLLLYREEGRRYSADLVVVMFYDNDVCFNALRADGDGPQKPLFVDNPDGLELTNVPVPRAIPAAEIPAESSHSVRQWLHGSSQLYVLLSARLKSIAAVQRAGISAGWITPVPLPNYFEVYCKLLPEPVSHAWDMTERILATLRDEVRSDGAELLVFAIPNLASVDAGVWDRTMLKYDLDQTNWSPTLVEETLGEICERQGITLVAAIEKFRDASIAGEALYFPRDQHWTAAGHALAARMLAERLADHLASGATN